LKVLSHYMPGEPGKNHGGGSRDTQNILIRTGSEKQKTAAFDTHINALTTWYIPTIGNISKLNALFFTV
jgi:hypothetical protein